MAIQNSAFTTNSSSAMASDVFNFAFHRDLCSSAVLCKE